MIGVGSPSEAIARHDIDGNNDGFADFFTTGFPTKVDWQVSPRTTWRQLGSATPFDGGTVDLELTPGFVGGAYEQKWAVYVDINRDGDFKDSGEKIFTGRGIGQVKGRGILPHLVVDSETGEEHILTGSRYRMRVVMAWADGVTGDPTPDAINFWGEAQDYQLLTNNPALIRPL